MIIARNYIETPRRYCGCDSLERRYRETDWMAVREELSKYLDDKPWRTEDSQGKRQQPEARRPRHSGRPADLHHRCIRLG